MSKAIRKKEIPKKLAALPTCTPAVSIVKRGMMTPTIARALGVTGERRYKSLEDRAVKFAQLYRYNSDRKGWAQRTSTASEAVARRALREYWDDLTAMHDTKKAADRFFNQVIGIVPCAYPCQAEVRFPPGGGLDIECTYANNLRKDSSVKQIQQEVLRIAGMLDILPPRLQGKPRSACKASDRKVPATEMTKEEQRAAKAATESGSNDFQLSPAQLVVSKIGTDMLMDTVTKGMLMWHTVGAGKTCAAVAAASVLLNRNDGWRVKWFSSAALKYQPLYDAFFTRICHVFPIKVVPSSNEQKNALIKQYIEVLSFSMLANAFTGANQNKARWVREARARNPGYTGSDPLYKTLLIFDEPHKIPQLKGGEAMSWPVVTKALRKSYAESGDDSARLILLDATPMLTQPGELAVMLNALHPEDVMPTKWEDIVNGGLVSSNGQFTPKGRDAMVKLGRGVISYLNFNNDRSLFAYGKRYSLNPVALSKKQRDKMYKECAKKGKDLKRGCVERAVVAVEIPKDAAGMRAKGGHSFPLLNDLVENIEELDKKDMQEHGKKFKHVIFTNIRNVVHARQIMKVLKFHGFKEVDPLKSRKAAGTDKGVIMLSGEGLADKTTVNGVKVEKKDAIINTFNNHKTNAHGEVARFMLIDGRFREGINVFDTRHFHLLQPLSPYEERQAIGRVLRRCGSTFLPDSDDVWQVRVHLYDAVDPDRNQSIYDILDVGGDDDRLNAMEDAERIASNIAFDRLVFTEYNKPPAEEGYVYELDVKADHLCDTPPTDGACPKGKSLYKNQYGVECCEQACKTAANAAGKCPKNYVKGASAVDPAKDCCYSRGSKEGKAIVAARKAGTVQVPPDAPPVNLEGLDLEEEGLPESDVTEIEIPMEVDEDDDDDEAPRPKITAATPARRQKGAACKPPLESRRQDGECRPGYKKIRTDAGKKCCKNACRNYAKPDEDGECPAGKEAFNIGGGIQCCRAVKKGARAKATKATKATRAKAGTTRATSAARVASCPEGSISRATCPPNRRKVVGVRANGNKCCADACPPDAKKPGRGGSCAAKYKTVRVHGQTCCMEK